MIWGTGTPRREFLHVDDLADACVFLMEQLRRGDSTSTSARAKTSRFASWPSMVRDVVHPRRRLTFDASKPDGTPRKLLDVSRLHATGLAAPHRAALKASATTYEWFLANQGALRVSAPTPPIQPGMPLATPRETSHARGGQ